MSIVGLSPGEGRIGVVRVVFGLLIAFNLLILGSVSGENLTASWQTNQMVGHDNVEVYPISLSSDGKMNDLIMGISNDIAAYSDGSLVWIWNFERKRALGVIDFNGDGIVSDVVIGSGDVYIYKGSDSMEPLWNYSVDGNVQALKGVDLDRDGKRDELIVATDKRIYCFEPENNTVLSSFPIGGKINSIDLLDIAGSNSKNIVVGTGRTMTDQGNVLVYSPNGALIGKQNLSENLGVIKVQSVDLDGIGKNTHIMAIYEIKTTFANTLVILNPNLSLKWSKENYASASPIDFDRDRKLDDIVALRTTFGLPQVHLINSEGSILRSYKKSEIDTRNIPSHLLEVNSYSQDSDGIFNDFAMVGKDPSDGYYLYGFKDAYEEPQGTNLPPVANAGPDINATVGKTITLSAFDSYDPEGKPLQYKWLLDGKLFKDSDKVIFSYQFDNPGVYEFNLTVKEGLDTASDVVVVTIGETYDLPQFSMESAKLLPSESKWLRVQVNNVKDLNTVSFNLTFNPKVVSLNDIMVGEFLGGGSPATIEPSHNIKVTAITGYSLNSAASSSDIHALILTCQLSSGSADVKYSDILLNYIEGNSYVSGINFSKVVDYSSNITDEAITSFVVRRLKDKDSSPNELLESGEIIEILYWVQDNSGKDIPIDEGDEFTITLQPKSGQSSVVSKTAPGSINKKYIADWGIKLFVTGEVPMDEDPTPLVVYSIPKASTISNIQNPLGWATALIELPPGMGVNGSGIVAWIQFAAVGSGGTSSPLVLNPLFGSNLVDKYGNEIDHLVKNGIIATLSEEIPPEPIPVPKIRFTYHSGDLDEDGNKNDYWTHVRNTSNILSTFNGTIIRTTSSGEQGKIAYLNMSPMGSGDTAMWYDANKNGQMGEAQDYVKYNGLYIIDSTTVQPVLDMVSDSRIFVSGDSTAENWRDNEEGTFGIGLGWLGSVFKVGGEKYVLTKEVSNYEAEVASAEIEFIPDMGCGCSEDNKIPIFYGKIGWKSDNETNSSTKGTLYIYDVDGNTEKTIPIDLGEGTTSYVYVNSSKKSGMIKSPALSGTSYAGYKIFLKNGANNGIIVIVGKEGEFKIHNGMEGVFGYKKIYLSMGAGTANPEFSILPDDSFHLMGPAVSLVSGDIVDLPGTDFGIKLDITKTLTLLRKKSVLAESGTLMRVSKPEYGKFLKEDLVPTIFGNSLDFKFSLLDLDDDRNPRDYFATSQNGSYINGSSIYTSSTGSQGTIVYYGWTPGGYSGIDKSTGLWFDANGNGRMSNSADYLQYNGVYVIDDKTIQPVLKADSDYRIFLAADSTNGSWTNGEEGTYNDGTNWLGAVFRIKGFKYILTGENSNYEAEIASAKVVTLADKGASGSLRDYASIIFGGKMAWQFRSGDSNSSKGTLFILDAYGNTEKNISVDLGSGSSGDVFTNPIYKTGMIKSSALSGTSFAGYKIFLKNATYKNIKVIVGKEGEFTISNNMDNAMGYSKLYMSMGAGEVNPDFSILPDNSFVFMGAPVSLVLGGTVDIPDTDYEAELAIDKKLTIKRVKKVSVSSGTKMKTSHPDYGDFLTTDVRVTVEISEPPQEPKYIFEISKLSQLLSAANLAPGSCFEVHVLGENTEKYGVCSGNGYFTVTWGPLVEKDLIVKIKSLTLTSITNSDVPIEVIKSQFYQEKNIGLYANDGKTPIWEVSPIYMAGLILKGYKDIYDNLIESTSCTLSLEWLQPLAGDKARNVNSALPIKFNLTKNGSLYNDTSVNVRVFSPFGGIAFNSTYGNGSESVRIEDNKFITNFKNGTVPGIYNISVGFQNNCQFNTSFELTNPPVGNPSGGGGGGAGSSGANGFISKIEKGHSGTVAFSESSSPWVKGIRIKANEEIFALGISVKYPSSQPYGTSHIGEEVYKFIEIRKSGPAEDNDIQEAVIEFQVEKKWLEENGIESDTVSLMRFSNGQWQKLDTEVTDEVTEEEGDFISFRAFTPGFSYFAICGLAGSVNKAEIGTIIKFPVLNPVVETPQIEDEEIIVSEESIEEQEDGKNITQEKENSALPMLATLILGGLAAGVAYRYHRNISR